ncbi:site-specific integrase [Enterocloster clostridioformis]|uniref:Phage integrase family n=1 Tax=Enterocloster clostridioformis TaxID=1531 RepID=A0A2X2VR73_9FIRM|nr:site-specific integrase [Enterocloster clostridioformis]MCA5579049.1 site-specific integrase [Enterocloster clostridioformis]SQB03939.1 Phage integrase family [Enterocloster clostridioformis]
MASIVKRGKSYSVVYYQGTGKKRQQVWESGLSYSTAKSRKTQIEHEQVTNTITTVDSKDMTVSEFLYEFIEKYGLKKWRASTYDGNNGLLENYVHPYLGDKKLRSIKTKTVDDYYHFLETEAEPATNMGRPMREHITAATIHDIHKVLRCAFNLAVRWEYISKNPFLNATLPEHHEKERVILEPEQILKVLEFTNRPEYYDYYLIHCAVLIAIGCTVRGGEIGGLQWDKINFEKQIILFDRAIDRVSKKNMDMPKMNILFKFPNLYPGTKTMIVLKQPKSDDTIRNVDVPQSVLNALLVLKEMQDKLKKELGPDGYMDYNLTICQANGRPIMTEHLNKRFKEILTEMNDPDMDPQEIVFHSLRHTSATTKLLMSGGDYNSVMQAGGWSNLEMLTRRYGKHSFASEREKLAGKMDDFLDGKGISEPQKNDKDEVNSAEQVLQQLMKSNPELLIEFARSFQNANKE